MKKIVGFVTILFCAILFSGCGRVAVVDGFSSSRRSKVVDTGGQAPHDGNSGGKVLMSAKDWKDLEDADAEWEDDLDDEEGEWDE